MDEEHGREPDTPPTTDPELREEAIGALIVLLGHNKFIMDII